MEAFINHGYAQMGEGHCWKCHTTYNGFHACNMTDLSPTPCNPLTCGKWYERRALEDNK